MRAELVVIAWLAACGPEHRAVPQAPQLHSSAERRGQHIFQRFCYQCHPNGAAGVGPALVNKPLPEVAIRIQVRDGLGPMPSFRHLLQPDEITAVASYVHALRRH